VAILGNFGINNFGNEATFEIMLDFVRRMRPDAEITCICTYPKKIERNFKIETLPFAPLSTRALWFRILNRLLLRLPRAIDLARLRRRDARRFDVMFVPGTGILGDFMTRSTYISSSLFGWCLAARLAGAKLSFVSIGAGPINYALNSLLMVSAARMAHYRSYRDEPSRNFMRALNVDVSGDRVYPDLVFTSPKARIASAGESEPRVTIGVGVMSYRGWWGDNEGIYDRYIEQMADFVIWCVERGHRIMLLEGDIDDRTAVDDLIRVLRDRRGDAIMSSVRIGRSSSLGELMRDIEQTSVVVATRFHTLVAALKLCRPTISISYSNKNEALMEQAGLGDFCQKINDFEVKILVNQLIAVLADRNRIEKNLEVAIASFARHLDEQEAVLASRFLDVSPSATGSFSAAVGSHAIALISDEVELTKHQSADRHIRVE
jgi:polysaccharide pyruvyl transferase WcaK-like protein